MTDHSLFITRCIELARLGLGKAAPNPMVGAVLVYDNRIIGEGYHMKYGEAHAEVNAIGSVRPDDMHLIEKSTLYVSLEPCSHFGKTPPCSDLIIKHKIPEVVIGCVDSFEKVSGRGIEKLKQAGVHVITGIHEEKCLELNKRFFTFHEKKRPYIILKWAQTLNGLICSADAEDSKSISNEYSRKLVHKWRSEETAIMVGTNTARNDNPRLDVREWKGKNPVRIVIDRDLSLPADLHLFDQSVETLVFNEKLDKTSGNLDYIRTDFTQDILKQVMDILYRRNIQSLFVEGGEYLLNSFIEKNLWDEARVITGSKTFKSGIRAPAIHGTLISRDDLHGDTLIVYKNC